MDTSSNGTYVCALLAFLWVQVLRAVIRLMGRRLARMHLSSSAMETRSRLEVHYHNPIMSQKIIVSCDSVGFMSVINRYDLGYVFRLIAGGPKGGMHAIYDISHELGKGSFASVYKAIHRATGQWYAVKMIQVDKIKKSAMKRDVEKASTFAREISILEKLNHPNICQLKETFFQDDNMSMFKFKTMPILS